jgi:hypothetical protein
MFAEITKGILLSIFFFPMKLVDFDRSIFAWFIFFIIGFAFEPPPFLNITSAFIEYAKVNIGKYFIGEKGVLPDPFVEGYAYMWHIVPPNQIPIKQRLCSIMVSEKTNTWGHRYRHQLVQAILSTDFPIDIYGRGCRFFSQKKDPRLHGEFKEMDTEMYLLYPFHIAIENFSLPHYVSEKIINPLLCGTTPIYWGCKNIHNYFPNTLYNLSGDIQSDMNLIFSILREPKKYVKKIDTNAIKEKTNILNHVKELFY